MYVKTLFSHKKPSKLHKLVGFKTAMLKGIKNEKVMQKLTKKIKRKAATTAKNGQELWTQCLYGKRKEKKN